MGHAEQEVPAEHQHAATLARPFKGGSRVAAEPARHSNDGYRFLSSCRSLTAAGAGSVSGLAWKGVGLLCRSSIAEETISKTCGAGKLGRKDELKLDSENPF